MDRGSSITPWDLECMLCDDMAEPKALPLSLLEQIRNGFSDELRIGSGGFAVVYKGKLQNRTVAVKRMLNTYMYEKEFQREVECLMMVKHKNVVRFLGYCADTQGNMARHKEKFIMADVQQRLLCFEYLPNGSLLDYITDTASGLQWGQRYQIINGICHGLHYLHRHNIVHLDLKPGNILLDANLVAKIADFGLSRCFDDMQSRVITVNIGGTLGYLAPEFCNGEITYQFDIYSLGVIIMEILTGKKGYHDVHKVVQSWSTTLEKSQSDVQLKQVRLCAEIGVECINSNPAKRPDTQHIIDRIDEIESMEKYVETGVITSRQAENAPNELHQDTPIILGETSSKVTDFPRKLANQYASFDTKMEQNILEQILEGSMEPTYLPFETLREITDGFSVNRIIGEEGFATVYKGIVGNRNFAVKRIRNSMAIDEKLFRREVDTLMKVKHRNVVRILGICSHTTETPMEIPGSREYVYVEKRERLLCFEYIANGSLDKKITDELRGLEWDRRYEIIRGICMGLHYLHMEKCILHMDLNPVNILLDNDMLPKITNFGLSRLEENSQTMSTNHFLSLGYCAPEILYCGRMSVKSDMYSLGVIIIELVTGHKGIPDTNDNILRRWRHRWNKSDKETSLKYQEQVTTCIDIGSLCQHVEPYERPSISQIMSQFVELESADSCRTIAHESQVGQINPPYWEDDMLGVEPLELQFADSGNDKELILSCSIELSNNTESFVAFRIQTTNPLPYSIEPNKDIVKPRSKCSVDITLPAANIQEHNNNKYTKGFIVQSVKVNEGLTTDDMNGEMFDEHITGHHVDEIYLSVNSEEPCIKEVTDSPTKQAKKCASSETRRTPIKPGSVQLVIKNNTVAPLLECNKKVMLELTGGDYTSDRPGLDLVAVVDVSRSMQGDKIDQLKTALQLLVRKLSPMDRLSVITFAHIAWELWPLRQVTETSQRELQDLISKIKPWGGTDISVGLKVGLNVLADRVVRVGRVAGIMLVSGGQQNYGDAMSVDVGDVPVYTFCFGGTDSDPMVLHQVAAKSMGGTFSHVVDQDTGGLTVAFSQCLAGLLSVAVQNLELTVAAVGGESKIVKVTAGSYPQEQQKDNSVTIRFGNLYSTEVRNVIVELLLPRISEQRSAEILDVTYSHNRSAGRMKSVAPPETLTVWRKGVEFLEEEKPAGLLSEEARLQTAQMIKEARIMADSRRLDDAQNKLVEAAPEEPQANPLLRTELQKLLELFKIQQTYEKQGRPYALSSESSHNRQRLAGRGTDIEVMRLFATPRMDKYLQQAKKFLKEPTMPLPCVDDDVKEELGALTVNVASREEEMRRLALDIVEMRRPPLPGGDEFAG